MCINYCGVAAQSAADKSHESTVLRNALSNLNIGKERSLAVSTPNVSIGWLSRLNRSAVVHNLDSERAFEHADYLV